MVAVHRVQQLRIQRLFVLQIVQHDERIVWESRSVGYTVKNLKFRLFIYTLRRLAAGRYTPEIVLKWCGKELLFVLNDVKCERRFACKIIVCVNDLQSSRVEA